MLENYNFKKVRYVKKCEDYSSLLQNLSLKINEEDNKENGEKLMMDKYAALFYYIVKLDLKYYEINKSHLCELLNISSNNPYWKPYLYEYLCKKLALMCNTVSGYVRPIDSHISQFNNLDSIPPHTWNMIQLPWIPDESYVCDPIWSSSPNDYFFIPYSLTKYTHILTEPTLETLYDPVITEKFRQYFDTTNNLSQVHTHSTQTKNNVNMIQLKLKSKKKDIGMFYHDVTYFGSSTKNSITISDKLYKKYTILEVNSDQINIYWRFPKQGIYIITLFIQSVSQNKEETKNYEALLSFRVQCDNDNNDVRPYLGCNTISYGVCQPLFDKFKLSSVNYHRGVIKNKLSPPAILELVFNKASEKISTLIQIRAHLEDFPILPESFCAFSPSQKVKLKPNCDNHTYTGILMNHLIDDEDDLPEEITFSIRIPKQGEYSIEVLCASTPIGPETEYILVAQYFIDMNDSSKKINY